MHIKVQMLNGTVYAGECDPNDTIYTVKTRLRDLDIAVVKQLQLCFNGNVLENDRTLLDYDIGTDSVLHCVIMPPNWLPFARGVKLQSMKDLENKKEREEKLKEEEV